MAKLTFLTPDGGELLFALRYPGQFIDYFPLRRETPYELSGVTLTSAEIYRVNVERAQAVIKQQANLRFAEGEILRSDFHSLAVRYLQMRVLSPVERLESLLWELAGFMGEKDSTGRVRFVLPLDNLAMASLCGISESYFKSIRRDLERTRRIKREQRHRWLLLSRLSV